MIIQTTAFSCSACAQQEGYLLEAIQDRLDNQLLPNTLFLILGVNELEPPSVLDAVVKRSFLEVAPAVIQKLQQTDIQADWMIGVATPQLLTALEEAFGPDIVKLDMPTIIAIQPDGLAHLTNGVLHQPISLIQIIMTYSRLSN